MNVYVITGQDLIDLRNQLADAAVTKLSVAIEGGVKYKINEQMWSLPVGSPR